MVSILSLSLIGGLIGSLIGSWAASIWMGREVNRLLLQIDHLIKLNLEAPALGKSFEKQNTEILKPQPLNGWTEPSKPYVSSKFKNAETNAMKKDFEELRSKRGGWESGS